MTDVSEMDEVEAGQVLERELEPLRALSYDELRARMPRVRRRIWFVSIVEGGDPEVREVQGESGTWYQVAFEVVWDGAEGGDIRVLASIDAGGRSALHPMTSGFILAPDGTFVGE